MDDSLWPAAEGVEGSWVTKQTMKKKCNLTIKVYTGDPFYHQNVHAKLKAQVD
jgi:hypothetical protein